jgi:hypothetical protein
MQMKAGDEVRNVVREQYKQIAESGGSCVPGCCAGPEVSLRLGYSQASRCSSSAAS